MTRELNTCGRCHLEARDPIVRLTLANLEREAYRDGRPHHGPMVSHEFRCADRDACEQRRTRQEEAL